MAGVPSPSFFDGYDDGFAGQPPRSVGEGKVQSDYDSGFNAGKADREEVQRGSSSNS